MISPQNRHFGHVLLSTGIKFTIEMQSTLVTLPSECFCLLTLWSHAGFEARWGTITIINPTITNNAITLSPVLLTTTTTILNNCTIIFLCSSPNGHHTKAAKTDPNASVDVKLHQFHKPIFNINSLNLFKSIHVFWYY